MAKLKNNRALPLQIPANKGVQAIESRFLALYDQQDAKQSFLRELLFTGYVLRSFGVSQAMMDWVRSGQLDTMTEQARRETIARLILGSNAMLPTPSVPDKVERQAEANPIEAVGLSNFGN